MEHTNARHAETQDLQACRGLLSRLHDLGVRHGDTNRFNFLIRDSKAILIDFDTAKKCDDRDLLLPELDSLTACFEDLSGRGGEGSSLKKAFSFSFIVTRIRTQFSANPGK
jgi:tRNA A-37 threonylcarbamoyl transferase component Bud32